MCSEYLSEPTFLSLSATHKTQYTGMFSERGRAILWSFFYSKSVSTFSSIISVKFIFTVTYRHVLKSMKEKQQDTSNRQNDRKAHVFIRFENSR